MKELSVGVIGCGLRVRAMLPLLLKNDQGIPVVLRAVCDVRDPGIIRQELAKADIDAANTQFYTDADQMLSKEDLDGVMIGTRCSLHTKYAVKVLEKNLPLFLEKPVQPIRRIGNC